MDSSKGQKIIAALYLITGHLTDNDPLRVAVRTHAVKLIEARAEEGVRRAELLDTLLGGAVIAGLLSEKNVSIIMLEVRRFVSLDATHTDRIEELFRAPSFSLSPVKKTDQFKGQYSAQKTTSETVKSANQNVNILNKKGDRHTKILSFINDRKSASIKDIVSLFPEVSEKTIQRELGSLVQAGSITKRGEKRWSIYLAVSGH